MRHPASGRRDGASPWSTQLVSGIEGMAEFEPFHREHQWHPESHCDLLIAAANEGQAVPLLLGVFRDGRLVTLVVAHLVDTAVPWRVGYGRIGASRARVIEVLRGGLLGDTSLECLEVAFDRLRAAMKELRVDAIAARHVVADSPAHAVFTKRPGWFCRDRLAVATANGQMTVPSSFAEFTKAQSKREREDNRRYEKRIRAQFGDGVRVEHLASAGDIDRFATAVESIARKTYQRGLGAGFHDSPQERARWAVAADGGWLHASVLWLGDEPAAFCTGFAVGETLWLEHIGYDPAHRRLRPGIHLLHRVIEQIAIDGRFRAIDFGIGDADYKRRLCSAWQTDVTVWVFAPTWRGLWLNGMRTSTNALYRLGHTMLDRLGLLDRFKRRWRRALEAPENEPAAS